MIYHFRITVSFPCVFIQMVIFSQNNSNGANRGYSFMMNLKPIVGNIISREISDWIHTGGNTMKGCS